MLYETLSQPALFFILIISGFSSGFIFDALNIAKKRIKNHFFCDFLMIFCIFFAVFIFYIINLKFNYGEIRLYPVFCFSLSLAIERYIFGYLLAKNPPLCYNENDENKIIEGKTRKGIKFKRRGEGGRKARRKTK